MELNNRIDALSEEIINSTQQLLRIKSVEGKPLPGKPFGKGAAEALDLVLAISKDLGFKTVNMDGYIGYAEYGQGEDYVAVLGHVDVVPEGDGWMYPPYAAEIHGGKIYARGSLDDKGPLVAALYGLKAVADSGLPLSKRVRIIYGTNEETGCGEIEYYLQREKPPVCGFTPDAEYPLIHAEKGFTMFNLVKDFQVKPSGNVKVRYIKGGLKANMVPEYCEAALESNNTSAIMETIENFVKQTDFQIKSELKDNLVIIKSYGVSAHGSTPELGKNAIMQLFALLENIDLGECDVADFIAFFNKFAGFETHGESFGVGLEDSVSGKLSFNIGVVDMEEDKITLILNLRYPVTYTFEDMMRGFNARIDETGIRVENMLHQPPLYYPEDHPLIKTLQKVFTEQTGLEAKPLAIGGGTYAKEMANIVAFGPIFPGKPDLDHQVNEYIEVEDLIMNAKIYAHAIYELAK